MCIDSMGDLSDLENIPIAVEDNKSLSTGKTAPWYSELIYTYYTMQEIGGCSVDVGDYDDAEDNDGELQ